MIARAGKLVVGLLVAVPFVLVLVGGFAAIVGKLMSLDPLAELGIGAVVAGGAGFALLFFTDVGQVLMQASSTDSSANLDKKGSRSRLWQRNDA